MLFIDKVRKYNTVQKGIRTPIPGGFSKPGLHIRLAAPIVGAYDRFSDRGAVEAVQPEAVAGVPVYGITREEKLDTLQDQSENLNRSASELNSLAKKLAEQFEGRSTESVSDESSLDYETASKPWYRKGALGSAVNWFQSGRRKGYRVMPDYDGESITSESETRELVQEDHEFTNSSLYFHFDEINLRSESPETTLESRLNSVNLESDDTSSLTPKEGEKIGLVQRITNMLKTFGDFLMSPFRASEVVDKDSLSISSKVYEPLESTAYGPCREGRGTPPPSYEEATAKGTQGQRNAKSWIRSLSSIGSDQPWQERVTTVRHSDGKLETHL